MVLNPTRVAILGLGEAGHELHLPALAILRDVEIVGGCDPSPGMRARATGAWRIPVFEDFGALLDENEPEVVIVATPPGTHLDLGLQALDAGAHVIMEKPFVASLTEADRLISAADAAGLRIALNHEFREMPILRSVRDGIASGETGPLVFLQLWQMMDMPASGEHGWRGELRHRTLYEAGVHLIDYAMAVFGEKPESVITSLSAGGGAGNAEDSIVTATLEFSGGRLASIVQSRLCKGPRQYFEARADTAGASFRASFGGRARMTAGLYRSTRPTVRLEFGVSGMAWKETGDRRTFLSRNPSDPRVVATREVLIRTLAAFRDGGDPPVDGPWGRDVLEVIVACYRSGETGSRVRLDSDEMAELAGFTLGGSRDT